ncbi:MAG: hypothetical protein KGI37_00485 [Alphaproteobacteria bacterium]|nr:hypothetical protein [Alphaproteobacteria bacterium]
MEPHDCGVKMAAGFWFAGRIIERLRAPRVLWLGEAFMSALSWAGVLLSNMASPVLMSVGAAGFGPYTVACDKLLQEEFTDDQRATLGSVASFTGSILYALFAPLIGLVADRFGIAAGLCFGYAFCSLSLPVFIRLFRRHF